MTGAARSGRSSGGPPPDEQPIVQSFVEEGLGNSSYLFGSRSSETAVVIDPLRDIEPYVRVAERHGLTITHVLDTHLHNDFVSGARELAARCGATVCASAEAGLEFDHRPLKERDRISVGELALEVVATPGHTPEHIVFLAVDGARAPLALFSGGALIVGGTARTDLLGEEMAKPLTRQLYRTIQEKILVLPDSVAVLPTHGAGSFCVAAELPDRTTTIGRERARNPLVRARSEDEFVRLALGGLPSYPVYFREMRAINRRGPRILGGPPALAALTPEAVREWIARGGAVLDVRPAPHFARGHIPGSYGIQLDAPLTTWAGWLIPFGTALVLLADSVEAREEAVRQLLRIGFDDLRGYLDGGMPAWAANGFETSALRMISVRDLRPRLRAGDAPVVLDVRSDAEWTAGHIPGAVHIENGRLPYDDLSLPRDRPIVVHCEVGNRSVYGMSVLLRRGYSNVVLLPEGFAGWRAAGFEVTQRESDRA